MAIDPTRTGRDALSAGFDPTRATPSSDDDVLLCDERGYLKFPAPKGKPTVLVCALADDGHLWHWDPVDNITWRKGRHEGGGQAASGPGRGQSDG